MKPYILLAFVIWTTLTIAAQNNAANSIRVLNPSFERHYTDYKRAVAWRNCQPEFDGTGVLLFPQFDNYTGVTKTAWEGESYLGLVTTIYGMQEAVSVRLSKPMPAGKCYEMTLWLANATRFEREVINAGTQDHANTVRLEIYGGQQTCRALEGLAEVNVQNHASWTSYEFFFQPTADVEILTLRAAYHRWFDQYNGHVLIDDISIIEPLDCDRVPQNGFTKFTSDFIKTNRKINTAATATPTTTNTGYPWVNERDIYNYLDKKDLPEFEILVPANGELNYRKLLQDKYGKQIICFVITGNKRKRIKELRTYVTKEMKGWRYPSWAYIFEEKITE